MIKSSLILRHLSDSIIYKLRGLDPDGDVLQFGVRTQSGSDVIRVENTSPNEANIYLNKELDREVNTSILSNS